MGDVQLTIGRHEGNDIVLPATYGTASNQHAQITSMNDGQTFIITDVGSKNGTWVNDRRITTKSISPEDEVRFGSHVYGKEDLWLAIRKKFYKNKTDFTAEYQNVMRSFQEYEGRKEGIYKNSPTPMYIRFGLTAIVILILFILPDDILDPNMRYPIIIGVGLLATFIATNYTKTQSQKSQALDQLKNEYDNLLICPKCNYPLLSKGGYHYWKGRKTCVSPKCNATYT